MTEDEKFFITHPDRYAHIRVPGKQPFVDKQRAVRYLDECELQFRSLGPHDPKRRRIIAYRVPKDNQILPIPMLLNADETVEDRDDILLPIIHAIMMQASK